MELEGHPTQDIVVELLRRGALEYEGTATGPSKEQLRFAQHGRSGEPGRWLFLPKTAYENGFEESPE